MDKGVTIPVEEQNYLKQRVTEDIMRDFTRYTLEEVKLAWYYGVRGEMGEFYGLNSATFYKWLKEFRYELVPPAYKEIEKYLPKPEENKPQINQQELDRSIADTLISEFQKLKDDGVYNFYDFGNVGYRYVQSRHAFERKVSGIKLSLWDHFDPGPDHKSTNCPVRPDKKAVR